MRIRIRLSCTNNHMRGLLRICFLGMYHQLSMKTQYVINRIKYHRPAGINRFLRDDVYCCQFIVVASQYESVTSVEGKQIALHAVFAERRGLLPGRCVPTARSRAAGCLVAVRNHISTRYSRQCAKRGLKWWLNRVTGSWWCTLLEQKWLRSRRMRFRSSNGLDEVVQHIGKAFTQTRITDSFVDMRFYA